MGTVQVCDKVRKGCVIYYDYLIYFHFYKHVCVYCQIESSDICLAPRFRFAVWNLILYLPLILRWHSHDELVWVNCRKACKYASHPPSSAGVVKMLEARSAAALCASRQVCAPEVRGRRGRFLTFNKQERKWVTVLMWRRPESITRRPTSIRFSLKYWNYFQESQAPWPRESFWK